MTQSQFMYDLMLELDGVPDEEKFVLMNDYTQYFNDRIDDGMSEELIIERLSSPKEIASSYKNGAPALPKDMDSVFNSDQKGKKTFLSVLKFILLIPVCTVYEIAAAALGLVLLVISLALCVAGAFLSVAAFMSAALNVGFILIGVGGVFLTFAFVMLCAAVFKGSVSAAVFFPGFMGRVLGNEKRERD